MPPLHVFILTSPVEKSSPPRYHVGYPAEAIGYRAGGDPGEEPTRTKRMRLEGQGPQNSTMLKMLRNTCSKKRAFKCIDGLEQCVAEH